MFVRLSLAACLLLLGSVSTLAQQPLHPPAPLVEEVAGAASPADRIVDLLAAQRAQEMGFPAAAVAIYQRLLGTPGGDRDTVILGLATALLDEGRADEVQGVLDQFAGAGFRLGYCALRWPRLSRGGLRTRGLLWDRCMRRSFPTVKWAGSGICRRS
jgi:hypothetical protein